MLLIYCLILTTALKIETLSAQDLKSIFHTPSRRNYDNLEILERSNFNDDSAPSTSSASPTGDMPRSYANAQVMLRFGGESDKEKCSCGELCQCKNQPQYIPVIMPHPHCYCVPPYYYAPPFPKTPSAGVFVQNVLPRSPLPIQILPPPTTQVYEVSSPGNVAPSSTPVIELVARKSHSHKKKKEKKEKTAQTNQLIAGQNENVVDEQTETVNNVVQQNIEVKNNNHPEILKTVTLSEDSIILEKSEDINKIKCLEEVSNKLEPKELSSNVKIVNLDLDELHKTWEFCKQVPKTAKKEIDECLIPYTSPKLPEPKLLVSYPIYNQPEPKFQPSKVVLNTFRPTIPVPTFRPVEPPIVQYSQSGYSVSEGSGFYSDPFNTVIYRKPTVVQIIPPQISTVRGHDRSRYILVPVTHNAPAPHTEDCCCCSCAKYVGEMNEQEQAL